MDPSHITPGLVRSLIAEQFPQWAHLRVRRVEQDGWDNSTFRLGDTLTVRLPNAARYVPQVEKEHRWLPKLAPHLPLQIPECLAVGAASERFPRPWSIRRWIPGVRPTAAEVDMTQFAIDLAEFLAALQRIDSAGGPQPGPENFYRGGDLSHYSTETYATIESLPDIDGPWARSVWEEGLQAKWRGAPSWVHGDVAPSNLLVERGRLSAVIDFGGAAVGDPACDLTIAWTFLDEEGRLAFGKQLHADAGTWSRARSWALWKALIVHRDELQAGSAAAAEFNMGWRYNAREVLDRLRSWP